MFTLAGRASAQDPAAPPVQQPVASQTTTNGNTTTTTSTAVDANGKPVQTVTTSTTFHRGKKKTDTSG
jgi:hypothetical protein